MEHETYINATEEDSKLPEIFAVTGKLSEYTYNHIIDTLCYMFNNKEHKGDITILLNGMKQEASRGVVTDKKTNKIYVNPHIRSCYQKTFYDDIINNISVGIIGDVKKSIRNYSSSNMYIEDISIDTSHGDLLLYSDGDYFNLHRDKNTLTDHTYTMYTGIFCIDSNIPKYLFGKLPDGTLLHNMGNTIVYLPLKTKPINYTNKNKQLIEHSFSQSRIPMEFVLFPSQAKHASYVIKQKDIYKLCLKLDFSVKLTPKNIPVNPMSYIQDCSCIYCNQFIGRYINDVIDVPEDVVKIILLYLGAEKRKECYCDYDCPCTCSSCCSDNGIASACEITDKYIKEISMCSYTESDTHCNGW